MTSNVLPTKYLSLPELEKEGVKHFFTTREFKGSDSLPFSKKGHLVMVKQVHGDDILVIDKPVDDIELFVNNAAQHQCDAIITNQKEIAIGVISADCLPALLFDPVRSVIAAVHAGWRGTIKGIVSQVAYQMTELFNCRAEDIIAGIGPVIGSCCYHVGDIVTEPMKEVNPEWSRYLKPSDHGKHRLDISGLNIYQLEAAGLLRKNIFQLGQCTSCNKELFPSYRRDGIGTGRIISGIVMGI
ncbi:MAG: peptidoglycan editing factor PgeF [Nitrospira sp.]|nr:peptidoglycan editing factor PgeF [Nitrospira sp.]